MASWLDVWKIDTAGSRWAVKRNGRLEFDSQRQEQDAASRAAGTHYFKEYETVLETLPVWLWYY